MKNSRQTAFEILNKIQRDASYSNLALDAALNDSQLDTNNKALTSAIVYGVTERLLTLDYQLQKYLTQPIKKLKPQVITSLRIGAYQILYMDKIPQSAAVNESVELVKKNGASYASGLVNAVLRKIAKNGEILPDENSDDYLSVKFSCPKWLTDMWINAYGRENAVGLLSSSIGSAPTSLRVNTLRTTPEVLINKLSDDGIKAVLSESVENALTVESGGALHKTECYNNGLFHVQDIASQLCCKALGAEPGDTVFDICSAPGGKAFTVAEIMRNNGVIKSFDIYASRLNLIDEAAERLGIGIIDTAVNDGSKYNGKLGFADKILCDVPCSGLGVIRKKPEIRYKNTSSVDKLPDLQYSILCSSVKYLKVGGKIIYSTCSLNPDENENIIKRFLSEHPEFESVRVLGDIPRYTEDTDYISLMPHIHNCDGFFIAGLKRLS